MLCIIKNNIHPRYPNVAVQKWINLCIELSKYENLTVTRLAHGLPMGAQLDYADEMTLFKAFSNRKKL